MHNIQEVTILLVEDDPSDARLIEKNLHRLNVTNDVVTVGDGQQALDYCSVKASTQGASAPRRCWCCWT